MPNNFIPLIILILTVLVNSGVHGQVKDLNFYYDNGIEACNQRDYRACLENFSAANRIRPNHQIIMYRLSQAFAYNDMIDSSSYYLKRALTIKGDLDINDTAFINLKNRSSFYHLQEFQTSMMAPENHSETVFSLDDRTLHIESIAIDPKTNRMFLGSVHKQKILEIDLIDHSVKDFIGSGAHGICSVFGMKADVDRRSLWVCSVPTEYMIESDSSVKGSSSIYQFDLDSGKLLKVYTINDQRDHWFGDLTIHDNGDVFVSDSETNSIYRVSNRRQEIEHYYHNDNFISLQGLDFSPNGRFLFLSDYVSGPYRLELDTKTILKLASILDHISLKSIDGLYFQNDALITTQNQVVPMRVTKYHLNSQLDTIIDFRYLEKGNPLLNEPTLGVVLNDWFYFVANSQWGGYDEQKQPLPYEQLQDIHIMRVKID